MVWLCVTRFCRINSCVGQANHRSFVVTLAVFVLTSLYGIGLVLSSLCPRQHLATALFYCPAVYSQPRYSPGFQHSLGVLGVSRWLFVSVQHGSVLHLCLVQQHCHNWVALPAGGAAPKHQLQRDRTGIPAGSEEQNRPEPPAGAGHRHGTVLAWLLQELGGVPHHGRRLRFTSAWTHRLGLGLFSIPWWCWWVILSQVKLGILTLDNLIF